MRSPLVWRFLNLLFYSDGYLISILEQDFYLSVFLVGIAVHHWQWYAQRQAGAE
jgi:hypothetical protein